MSLLTINGITKKGGDGFALGPLSLTQQRSHRLAIAGETGSGKSTLLKMIAGLIQPDAGIILLDGQPVKGPDYMLIPGHPRIAYLSQHYELRNNYRVAELLEMANKIPDYKAVDIYHVCRIGHLLHRWTNQLSGGEKQRVSLARLLAASPALLVLDEPFSNLDLIHKTILKKVLADAEKMMGITCLLASHDPQDLLSWADEILVLKAGNILQKGTPETLYRQPADEYVAGILGGYIRLTQKQLSAFADIAERPENKPLLFRPEDFLIVPPGSPNAVPGIITAATFWGGYYELEAALAEMIISIRTLECHHKKGDEIAVLLRPGR